MNDGSDSVGGRLDEVLRQQGDELAMMREALRVERARSDLLWDLAVRREEITEEQWLSAQDADTQLGQRLQEAKSTRRPGMEQLPG